MVWIKPFEKTKRMRPMWLWERLWTGEPENYGGRRYAMISLCHSICARWDIRADAKIVLVRDARDWIFPLLDDMDPIVFPELTITPSSRWQRFVLWVKRLFRKPVAAPVEIPPIHEETAQLEEWGTHAGPFYHSTRVGYGPESNVLAWTGMESREAVGWQPIGAIVATSPEAPSS